MFKLARLVSVLAIVFAGSQGLAKGGEFGLNLGLGMPFLTQVGIDYQFSDKFGITGGYNLLDLSVGDAKTKLSMPELLLRYHPFAGSFFLGAGVGSENLNISGTSTAGTVEIDVTAMTTIAKLGWMWGSTNGGFWFGVDMSFIMPSSPDVKIEAPGVPTNDPTYQDAVDAADKFGKTSFTNITFARFGWLF